MSADPFDDIPRRAPLVDPGERLESAEALYAAAYAIQRTNVEGFRAYLDSLEGRSFGTPAEEARIDHVLGASWGPLAAGTHHLAFLAADLDRVEAATHGGD